MKKSLVFVLFFALFFSHVSTLQAFIPAEAIAKSDLEKTDTGAVQNKTVQEVIAGNAQFEKGIPNVDGLAARLFKVSWITASACELHLTGCNPAGQGLSTAQAIPQAFASLYAPQATTGTYIADLMNSAGLNIARPVYAQGLGIGFSSLDPILDTWKVFRNVAYLFYVILFLIIGFMIMFRQKISGQAAVTAQQALPNIIISLIAVTFSYAIAGLMIDLMYILMYLIIGLFPTQTFGNGTLNLRQIALDKDIFNVVASLFTQGNLVGSAYQAVANTVKGLFNSQFAGAGEALGAISGFSFIVVFSLAMLFGTFRLFFELLKTYISIVITIVLSPLALMLGALPGNNAFGSWLKTLIANLAIFPGILLILSLSFILIGNTSAAGENPVGGFLPPYLPGRGSGNAISLFLGLGVLLILPDLTAQIKKSLGGSGGVFEQFANNFTSSIEKGWKGGELVPGLGISDTRKMLGKQTGGLSGENVTRKGAILARGGISALGGGLSQTAGYSASRAENALRDRFPALEQKMERPVFGKKYDPLKGFTGPHIEKDMNSFGQRVGDKNFTEEKKP